MQKDKRIVFSQLTPDEQSMSIGDQSNSASYSGNANSSSSSNSKKPTATTIGASGTSSSTRHASAAGMAPKQQKAGKRPGRKPSKINATDKLERSRQSARECRARKKLRYQYLEELVINREKAVFAIRDELKLYKQWCNQLDAGGPVPEALIKLIVNEDLEKSRRQREQAEKALEKQQKRQQQEQKTSSSSSSISSSTSSTGSSTSSPPKSSPPPASNLETPTTSSASSSSNQPQTAAAHVSRLMMQQQQQQQLLQKAKAAQGGGAGQVFRPQTLKVEPSSPTWSQIEHLLPKLSPTQPQYPQQQHHHFPQQQQEQDQTAQPGPSAAGPSTSSQRTASLTRQEAFDMTTALQQSVQQQLQQVKGMLEQRKEQQQRLQQEQQQQQQQYQHLQERQGLQSQLSIPESLSNFILSTRLPGSSEAGDQYGELLQQESLPSPQHYQGPQQYQPQYKHVPQSLVNQPQRTTPNYVPPPNFLDISNSTPNQRTLQQQYMTKAKSDPSTSNTADFLSFSSMDSFPTTCSASPGSVPSFFDSRDVIRSRSLSNPSYMFSVSRNQQNVPLLSQTQGYTYSSPTPYTSSSGAYQSPAVTSTGVTKSQTFSSDSQSIAGPTLGFFSGNTLGPQGHSSAMLPTTSFPSSGPVESESPSSSDENLNEQDLFQFSTLTPHKRTLSDPILHGGKMRKTAPEADDQQQQRQPISAAGASPFFSSSADEALFSDPHTTLKNLTTTMRCFSSTRTSNTPSPSPSIGLVPMGVNSPSPTPSGGSASRSGSFSRSSPAPTSSVSPVPSSTCTSALPSLGSLPSLSSLPFYDTEDFALSPAAHAAVDTALDIFSSTVAARDPESGFPTVDCSNSSGLQASIDPIPEFLSYFSDIQAPNRANPGISTASSVGQGTSFLTQMDVNIPNIIDERLEDRDGSQ
ncbi:CAMP-responsive element-binding protein-like 2 [Plakobranchus ocellatus]|uniref:cAMP-responsive element-binding protein-like 2 n=1 Tax=Plakobranchus ocellatus TaxID=259542 RepID=A0AAV3ZAV3_9GAST|nr:CAMP-responsive element-binding protein-like 2 [Plakobranchus ocellatus]